MISSTARVQVKMLHGIVNATLYAMGTSFLYPARLRNLCVVFCDVSRMDIRPSSYAIFYSCELSSFLCYERVELSFQYCAVWCVLSSAVERKGEGGGAKWNVWCAEDGVWCVLKYSAEQLKFTSHMCARGGRRRYQRWDECFGVVKNIRARAPADWEIQFQFYDLLSAFTYW